MRLDLRDEKTIVAVLCVLAALRVFLFSAAFPFFNNVDEQAHFDLVYKYAHGHVPRAIEPFADGAARLIALYDSPEFNDRPEEFASGAYPLPHWPLKPGDRPAYEQLVAAWAGTDNHESTQPPLYYAVAGSWLRVGEALGVSGGQALYWTRFLNVVIVGLVTWLGYAFASMCFPDRPLVKLGVPFLLAFFPQDAFYAINNDIVLPLAAGAALFYLVRIARRERLGFGIHAAAGLLVAASILTKLSSIAIVPLAFGLVGSRIATERDAAARNAAIARGVTLAGAALIPVGIWCARNYLLFGDSTGSTGKLQFLGWTPMPLSRVFSHPIFTPSGMAEFWRQIMATFWRGEFVWAGRRMFSPAWDAIFALTSLGLLATAVITTWIRRARTDKSERLAVWTCLASVLLSLGFMATISVAFDFGDCLYPSRAMPYMTSGRLILGSLIPFAVLYVLGLDAALPKSLALPVRFATLAVPVALFTISEIAMSKGAFFSLYNWLHMIRA
jgi:hypothetical protein